MENTQPTDKYSLGQVLVFDKPLNWTSFDIVNKVRCMITKSLGLKKLKVGHAGTLDPLATGLLIVCTGKKTKEITTFQDHDKEYIATIRLGATTPSFDLETEVNQTFDTTHITDAMLTDCVNSFLGQQLQYPPVYSAKKINGQRAYVDAHKGNAHKVEVRPQLIEIKELEILNRSGNDFVLRVLCSKGTYIRSLANDIGKKLCSGAHLVGLRRTKIGDFNVENAITIQQFEDFLLENN